MRFLSIVCVLTVFTLSCCQAAEEPTETVDSGEIVTDADTDEIKKLNPKGKSRGKAFTKCNSRKGEIEISGSDTFSGDDTVTIWLHSVKAIGRRSKGEPKGDRRRRDTHEGTDVSLEEEEVEELEGGRNEFSSFEKQNFELGNLVEDDTYSDSGLDVSSFSMSTELKKKFKGSDETVTIGKVTLKVYIFKEAGQLNVDGELSEVFNGSVKINIVVEDFAFCSTETSELGCGKENGAGLDVIIAVKSKGGKKSRVGKRVKNSNETLDVLGVGGLAAVRMSKKIKVDDGWQDLPSGFPRYEGKRQMTLVTVRFPKFVGKGLYDPTVDYELEDLVLEDDDDDDDNDDVGGGSAVPQISLLLSFGLVISKIILYL